MLQNGVLYKFGQENRFCCVLQLEQVLIIDTPPNSLIDSTPSSKVKTVEG
jgi:hypothetical protein